MGARMDTVTKGAMDFEPEALADFLAETFGGKAPVTIERIAGGQSNPTYFVTRGDVRLVLRKQPGGPIFRGAHAIDREYRVLEALHPQGVPVARPTLYHADPDLLGTPFYLMERIEGPGFCRMVPWRRQTKTSVMPCGWVWPTRWPPCTTSAPKR